MLDNPVSGYSNRFFYSEANIADISQYSINKFQHRYRAHILTQHSLKEYKIITIPNLSQNNAYYTVHI